MVDPRHLPGCRRDCRIKAHAAVACKDPRPVAALVSRPFAGEPARANQSCLGTAALPLPCRDPLLVRTPQPRTGGCVGKVFVAARGSFTQAVAR